MKGMDIFDRNMKKLIKSLDPDAVEPILYRGAQVTTKAVQSNVNGINDVTGNLRRSPVTKKMSRLNRDNPAPSIAAIDRKIGRHAHLVEFGTKGVRVDPDTGKEYGVMPAQPFFRPAWDSTRGKVKQQIKNDLANLVKGAVR